VTRRSSPAIAELYDEYVWRVYGFFGYRVRSREEAEDLTQLTFERAVRAWHRFDETKASARTWLMTIAHNLLIDHYRGDRSSRHEPLPEDEAGKWRFGQVAPPDAGLGISPELEAALARLGDRERELIALRFGGDMTGPEIAAVTGLTVANVQQILSRSLRRLRDELESAESSPPASGARRGVG